MATSLGSMLAERADFDKYLASIYPDYANLSAQSKSDFFEEYASQDQATRTQFNNQLSTYKRTSDLDDTNFIRNAYFNTYGRYPTNDELTTAKSTLTTGTRDDVVAGLNSKPEDTYGSASAMDAMKYDLDPYSPVYGTSVGGVSLPSTPDLAKLEQAQRYGQTVEGYSPVKYGETVRGLGMVDYGKEVQTPMDQWEYEQSPAFKAKQELMSQQVGNQLAARGIRGATPVNIMADQTRKLLSEDYTNERNFEFQNLLQKYQAQGLEYDKAYQAASQEYGSALMSQNQGAAQAQQNALTQYQLNLAQYQDMYNNRSKEASSAYDKIINDIKIGQSAAGNISSAGSSLSTNSSNAINAAGTAASNAALQGGIASAGLYSGLGNVGANLFGNTSAQKTLGTGTSTTGLGSTISGLFGNLGG